MAKPKPWEDPERGKDGKKQVPPVKPVWEWPVFDWTEEYEKYKRSREAAVDEARRQADQEHIRQLIAMAERGVFPPVVIPDPVHVEETVPVIEESWYERMKRSIEAENGNN